MSRIITSLFPDESTPRNFTLQQIGLLYCRGARAKSIKEIVRIERQIDQKLKELNTKHEPYIEKVKRLDKEYKTLIFNLAENGKATLTELGEMSLLQRLEYQKYIVEKLERVNRQSTKVSGRH